MCNFVDWVGICLVSHSSLQDAILSMSWMLGLRDLTFIATKKIDLEMVAHFF